MPWITINSEPPKPTTFEDLGYVQVVRCKDCKHWYPLTKTCNNVDGACCQSYVADDWYCADGARKTE